MTIWKFGGACFSENDRLLRIARKVADWPRSRDLVVVVSAKQGVTDQLIAEMSELNPDPPHDALDTILATGEMQAASLLAAAVARFGRSATVIPPWEVFRTDDVPHNATIEYVHAVPIVDQLERCTIPIVPGFVGATQTGILRTLGRGGSDYSAVALGVWLRASEVCLFKADVDGIYSANPHLDGDARRIDRLSHVEALCLARQGARVLNSKAAALASESGLTLWVRNAFEKGGGTQITSMPHVLSDCG
jgi:aspartate kinase